MHRRSSTEAPRWQLQAHPLSREVERLSNFLEGHNRCRDLRDRRCLVGLPRLRVQRKIPQELGETP